MSNRKGSNIEIRAAAPDEMAHVSRITTYAFADNTESPEPPPLELDQTMCAFDGSRMVASSGAFAFKMRFNGRTVAADGVTAVGTDPGYRRRGIVRQLMSGLLQRSRDNDVPISILWASMAAIYQRFGYGLATTSVSYDIHPRFIQFQYGEQAPGTVRLVDNDDALPLLKQVYRQYSGPGNGLLHRVDLYWGIMLRRQNDQHTHIAVYFDPTGEATGYLLYRTRWAEPGMPEPSQVIDVYDFSWTTIEAYRGLWQYLAGHDLANRVRMEFVPEDDPAPGMLLEPRMLKRKTWDGIWMRVVDVAGALSARGYDTDGEAVVEIVDDDVCAWNNGRYALHTTGGSDGITDVTRVKGSGNADIIAPPGAFASLVSGHARASDLARTGRLSIADPSRAAMLDHLFSTRRRPHCPNMF